MRVRLEPTPVASALFDAILERQCTHAECDGQPVSAEELKRLERAGTGNTVQMGDPAFVEELKHWIRSATPRRSARGTRLGRGREMPRSLRRPVAAVFACE